MTLIVRDGTPADIAWALEVWSAADAARRGTSSRSAKKVRGYLAKPDAFFVVAEDRDAIVGVAIGMQALDADGAGPPIGGLCHIGAVMVVPDLWGEGIGRLLVTQIMDLARDRGYERAQLWTQVGNERARRLYEGLGFRVSGREKDHHGERIVHFVREL